MHNEAFYVRVNELNPWARTRKEIKYLIHAPSQYFVIFTLSLALGH